MDTKSHEFTDKLGSVASTLCAIHCAICGFLPFIFTASGFGFLIGHEAEWVFTATAIVFGLIALIFGWRQHGSMRVLGLLIGGIVLLFVSRGLEVGLGHGDHHDDHHDAHVAEAHDATAHDAHGHHEDETHHGDKHGHDDTHGHEDTHGHDEQQARYDAHGPFADPAHLAGTIIGVFAGFILLLGHVLNIRASRRVREECCDTDMTTPVSV